MKSTLDEVNKMPLDESKSNPEIETKLEPSKLIETIKKREEMPAAYLAFLVALGSLDKKESKITLKVLRLYIYSRSKFRGDPKNIKLWLQNGSLSGDKFGTTFKMSVLYKKLRLFSKMQEQKEKLSKEVDEAIEEITLSPKKMSKRKEESNARKEFKISDIEESREKVLDEILFILDKTETLISSRNDQW